ncbi:hypothetical protein DEM34_14305 [Spiribacter halobius]|uniref:Entericidin n=1 Tax=Sediminicurvatus halobius TaxID=2182432 RepID=A0A2U2MYN6_9GAMM|nr:hypothetical protein DEM34_14305 [Spiribacter halobius]
MLRASIAFLMLLIVAIQGCNTMEGMGKDIESTGQAIEEEASD